VREIRIFSTLRLMGLYCYTDVDNAKELHLTTKTEIPCHLIPPEQQLLLRGVAVVIDLDVIKVYRKKAALTANGG
jgi:hypothetical protein